MTPKTTRNETTNASLLVAESVADLLHRSRENLGMSLDDVAARLKLPLRVITKLESATDAPADDVYTRIYLKAYCQLIGLESKSTVHLFRQERHRTTCRQASMPIARRHPLAGIPAWQMLAAPRVLRSALLIALAVGLGGYFCWSIINIVTPPSVTVVTPPDGYVTQERAISVEGRTDREVNLRVNGKPVAPDNNGRFHDVIELREGLNVINVVASRKHSKETIVSRRVIVEPTELPTAMR